MPDTVEIPLFPLGTVLYPAGRLALRIFETRYVDMTMACLGAQSVFGVVLIRAGFEVGTPAIPCEVGCSARIIDYTIPAPGLFNLTAHGESVFRVHRRWTQPDGLVMGAVELLEPPDPLPLPARYEGLATLLRGIMESVGEEQLPRPYRLDDAAWVGYRVAELLPVNPEVRQRLLELRDPLQLLGAVEQLVKELGQEP